MKKFLKDIPLKKIFWFYFITSLYSIFWINFLNPTKDSFGSFTSYIASTFNIYNFDLYSAINFFNNLRFFGPDIYDNAILQVETTFPLLILTASLIFFFSKFKDSRMLRYLLSLIMIFMVIGFIYGLVVRIHMFKNFSLSSVFLFLLYRTLDVFIFLFHYHVIIRLNAEDEHLTVLNSNGSEEPVLASRNQRFMNYVIDSIPRVIVTLLVSSIMVRLVRFDIISGQLTSPFEEYLFRFLLLFFGVLMVYFFLESLFLRSPAKFFTNTSVIVKQGKRRVPSIGIRTLVRLIPVIDFLSYIALAKGEGFHDAWSNTIVVKNKPKGIPYGWYFIIFPLIMLLPFTPSIIKKQIAINRYTKVSKEYEEHKIERQKRELQAINEGVLFEKGQHIYIIDSVDIDNIYASKLTRKNEYKKFNEKYSLLDFHKEYGDQFDKEVFLKNNLKGPLTLINSKFPILSDISLRQNSWSYNTTGQSANSYLLEIKADNCSSCYLKTFKPINGTLSLQKESYLSLKIDTEKEKLRNEEYIVEVIITNKNSNLTNKYHIKFTKYGVLDFYQIKDELK